jgi:hypothetical protein
VERVGRGAQNPVCGTNLAFIGPVGGRCGQGLGRARLTLERALPQMDDLEAELQRLSWRRR